MALTTYQVTFVEGSEQERLASSLVLGPSDFAKTEAGLFLGDGITPANQLTLAYDPYGVAANYAATLSGQIQQLQQRPVNGGTTTAQMRIPGALCLGQVPTDLEIATGFTFGVCTAVLGEAASGADVHVDVKQSGSTVYTFVIPAGQTTVTDLNPLDGSGNPTGFANGADVTFNVTQIGSTKPGRNLTLMFAAGIGTPAAVSMGAVGNLTATADAASLTLSFGYAPTDANDELDHFEVRYRAGSTAPTALTDGTPATDVPVGTQSTTYNTTIGSLGASTTYSVTVWPQGADGLLGTPASITATTAAASTNPPGTGSITPTPNPTSVTITITEPTDNGFTGGWLRRNNLTLVPPATVTSNRPALQGYPGPAVGTAGTWVPRGTTVVVDDGLPSASNFAYTYFSSNGTQINTTGASASTTTLAAPTGTGQGKSGLIPTTATYGSGTTAQTFTYGQTFTTNFSAGNSMLDTNGGTVINVEGPSWREQSQGPAEPTNVDIITDPDNAANNILRMRERRITNGFFNSNFWQYDAGKADGTTDGTGWYCARLQFNGAHVQWGALEFTCRIGDSTGKVPGSSGSDLTTLANNCKGGNFMWYTDQSLAGTAWPQDELDLWEVFSAGQAQINNHTKNTSMPAGGNTNQQCYSRWNLDIRKWTTVTCLVEPPPAGNTGGNGRLRVWYQQDGVDLGSGTGVPNLRMDTNTPYVGSNMGVPNGATAANAAKILQPQAKKFIGLSLEYTGYWADTAHTVKAATFSVGTGTTSTTRQAGSFVVDSVTLWSATAS